MEFGWDEFDRHFVDLDPDLLACVAEWFVERFEVDFHPIENPLAEIIDDAIPFILADLQNQRTEVLMGAATEAMNIFPEGVSFLRNNDAVYPFYQISSPSIDTITGFVLRRQASLGLLISPAELPFAIKVETVVETSTSMSARYRTILEIIDRYDGENFVEIAFYDLSDTLGVNTTLYGSDERLHSLCMYSALKIGDLELLDAYEHITRNKSGMVDSVLRRFGKK